MADLDGYKETLLHAITQVHSDSSFAVARPEPRAANPGLVIEELGPIGFPLSTAEAQRIITKCRKSPVGKGSETIQDDTVRKSWELSPSQFSLTNPRWGVMIADALSATYEALGLTCGRENIHAQLYKLLIYEEGAFFRSHQDTEKAPGMFGTMVIALPSKHEGGQVVLSHNKKEFVYDSAKHSSVFEGASFAAWYSNVYHEVKPIISGYRVVVTYNLIQTARIQPQRALCGSSQDRLKDVLATWNDMRNNMVYKLPPYFVYELEHRYSEDALRLASLKGDDYRRAMALETACRELGMQLYFGTLEKIVHKDDQAWNDIFSREDSISEIVDMNGSRTNYSPLVTDRHYLNKTEIEEDDEDYDGSEHEGWTGNEGCPSKYWYQDTVMIIVPNSGTFAFTTPSHRLVREAALWSLKASSSEDLESRSKLFQLCEIAIDQACEEFSSDFDDGSAPSLDLVATIAVQEKWVELYAAVPAANRRSVNTARAIGKFIATDGLESVKETLEESLQPATDVDNRFGSKSEGMAYKCWTMLQNIQASFTEMSPSQSQTDEFATWFSGACKGVSKIGGAQSIDDAEALAQMAIAFGMDMVKHNLEPWTRFENILLLSTFISGVEENRSHDDKATATVLQRFLERTWSNFSWVHEELNPKRDSHWFGSNAPSHETTENLNKAFSQIKCHGC